MIKKYKMSILIIVFCLMINTNVCAEVVSIEDFNIENSLEVLEESEYSQFDFSKVIEYLSNGEILEAFKYIGSIIYDETIGNISIVEKNIINLVLIIIASAFFTNFASVFSKDNISDTGFYICYLMVITIIVSLFEVFIEIASTFVTMLLQFVSSILPAYLLSVALFNHATAIGYYEVIILVITIVQFLFLNVVIPLIKIHLAISLVNNISREKLLSKTSDILSKIIDFLNKALLGLVTGINMVQCLILPSVDAAKNNSIKKIIGSLPVFGDGAEGYATILTGSASLIKNSIGAFAICVILVICAIPYLKVLLYSISMHFAAALIQPVADARIVDTINCLNLSLNMIMKVIITNGLLFIISIAIVSIFTSM